MCDNSPTQQNNVSLAEMKVNTNDVDGWILKSSEESPPNTLYDLIDGGAPTYIDRHLEAYLNEFLFKANGTDTTYLGDIFFIMNFGSAENATEMYRYQKTYIDGVAPSAIISGFHPSVAFADTTPGGGITAFAHFGKFYFEMPFSGYENHLDALIPAGQFLNLLKARAE
jgi:hypothetical protein